MLSLCSGPPLIFRKLEIETIGRTRALKKAHTYWCSLQKSASELTSGEMSEQFPCSLQCDLSSPLWSSLNLVPNHPRPPVWLGTRWSRLFLLSRTQVLGQGPHCCIICSLACLSFLTAGWAVFFYLSGEPYVISAEIGSSSVILCLFISLFDSRWIQQWVLWNHMSLYLVCIYFRVANITHQPASEKQENANIFLIS